jgi:hypothetical protein
MTRIKAALLAATTVLAATPALAQEAGSLRAGTPIELRTVDALDSGNHAGTRFQLEVANPVMKDGKILIPAGSPAIGEIVTVRDRDEPGRTSRIVARLVSVKVAGRTVRLAGGLDDTGTSLVGVIPTGTSARGFVDENVAFAAPRPIPAPVAPAPVMMAEAAPAPMPPVVAHAAPAPVQVAAVRKAPRIVVPGEQRVLEGPRLVVEKPTEQLAGARRPLEIPFLETKSDAKTQFAAAQPLSTVAKITTVSFVKPKVTVLSRSRTNAQIVSGGVTTHYVY